MALDLPKNIRKPMNYFEKPFFFIVSRISQKFGSHTDISHFYIHLHPIIDKLVATLADSRFFKNFLYQGGVKSTVSWIFEDLKFKISEGYDQNWCFPDSAQLAVSV